MDTHVNACSIFLSKVQKTSFEKDLNSLVRDSIFKMAEWQSILVLFINLIIIIKI